MKRVFLICASILAVGIVRAADPLPSWNKTPTKSAIIDFVKRVTTPGGINYVLPQERIATFDNDGTLWAEQPVYFQMQFALDRMKPATPPKDEKEMLKIVAAAHSGMTTDEFQPMVADWLATAKHPTTGQPYTKMVYQPMLELLTYLREKGFKTFIVSGGGVEFMRAFAEKTYGIPPEQVIGSSGKLKYETREEKPVLIKTAEVQFVDDGPGKAVGIQTFIGRRPIMAFGNSDGDQQMLEWTTAGTGARFALLVHHDDEKREWSYDRTSPIGKLDKAWNEAVSKGWTVVSMKDDWKVIYPK